MDQYPKVYLYRRIVQAKLFIDQHYSEKIDIDNIADEAFFSKFHFIRLFTKTYNKTPHQYLTSVRINKAKLLLQNGLPVSDVCLAVGFDSLSSFSGLFKKSVGINASAYYQEQKDIKLQTLATPLKFVPGCFAALYPEQKNSNFEEVSS